ncbi:MAG TPA: DUF1858 domain-containing protein [Candidatus Deferrimicrobium sp.]|nr:DUF1858 domain-containing protein [Candidatus Deferrimicrobium sp.]
MSSYMKRFVLASLSYLGLAALLGIFNGIFDVTYFGLFAHTHFSLLGFMAMIVFGIGYFILPRFNGTDLRFPSWVPVHFYLANITLIGMVVFRSLAVSSGSDVAHVLFILCAAGQGVSLFMFIVNIWLTIAPVRKTQSQATSTGADHKPLTSEPLPASDAPAPLYQASATSLKVTAESKIADLVDAVPSVKETLVAAGLHSLAMPGHLNQVRSMGVTLGMAATRHGLDVNNLITEVEHELRNPVSRGVATGPESRTTQPPASSGTGISPSVLIGQVMTTHPQTKDVFQKYFGSGCFECPGQMYESIDMACRMHGVDQQKFLSELNAAANV